MKKENDFTFNGKCDVCGQRPVYIFNNMCAVCTHGEAAAIWDWLDYDYKGNQLKRAYKVLADTLSQFLDEEGALDGTAAFLLKVDSRVAKRIRRLTSRYWEENPGSVTKV